MIYLLFPRGDVNWGDVRLFSTYAMLETAMLCGAEISRRLGMTDPWCVAVGYDGDEELRPVFLFEISPSGDILRNPFILSP